jgi:threonine dehydratase
MRTISIEAVRDAAAHMYEAAIRTPMVRLDLPFAPPDTPDVYLKLESLQPIGSFKLRGAWNAVRRLPLALMRDGVWTVSAGNAARAWHLRPGARASRAPSW